MKIFFTLVMIIGILTGCNKDEITPPKEKEKFLLVRLLISDAEKDFDIEVLQFNFSNVQTAKEIFIIPQRPGIFWHHQKTEIPYLPGIYRVSYLNAQGRPEFFSKYYLLRK